MASLVAAATLFAAAPAHAVEPTRPELGEASTPPSTPTPTPSESTPAPTTPAPAPTVEPGRNPMLEAPRPDPSPAPVLAVDAPSTPFTLPTTITGTRTAGSEVQVQVADGTGQALCIVPASTDTSWDCSISTLPEGPSVPIRVVALLNGQTAERTIPVAWLGAPTISASEQATTAGQVGGTAYPGASVSAVTTDGASCIAVADASGAWTCILSEPLATGTYSVSATQSASFYPVASASSPSVGVVIDKDPPPVPALSSPRSGARVPLAGGRFTGTGDDGNTVLLFAGVHPLCQATVSASSWACDAAAVPAGSYEVTAVQLDRAGNASASSSAVRVRFDESVPTPSSAAPVAPGTTAPPSSAPSDSAPAPAAGSAPATPPLGQPEAGPPVSPISPWIAQLGAPTVLGSSLAPLTAAIGGGLSTAFALSGGTFALVLLPGLLASQSLSSRFGRLPSLTGRNRRRGDLNTTLTATMPANRWVIASVALAAASALVVLTHPVLAQSNYLRLILAVVLALGLVNAVGTVAVVRVARGVFGVDTVVSTRLPLLGIAAVTALLTRLLALAPPLAFGQVLGMSFGARSTARQRSAVSLAQVAALTALTVAAWSAYGAAGSLPAVAGEFIAEFTATVTFGAASSAAIAMLPLRSLPGRSMLEHSRPTWVIATIMSWTLLFTVLTAVTTDGSTAGLIVAAIAAVAFAVFSLAAWAWVRFVEPAFAR